MMSEISIFISHSYKDKDLVKAFAELLKAALSIRPDKIRCTSLDGHGLSLGERVDEQLRQEVIRAKVFIGFVTDTSIESAYVLFEMGARWGRNNTLFPILGAGADSSLLRGPLTGRHALSCDSTAKVLQILIETANALRLPINDPSSYQAQIEAFVGANTEAKCRRAETPTSAREDVFSTMQRASRSIASLIRTGSCVDSIVNSYLVEVGNICRMILHPSLTWVDVMIPLSSVEAKNRQLRTLITEDVERVSGWLSIVYSEVPRNTEPRLIPLTINGTPFRGSAMAFKANGIDYLDRLIERLDFNDYNLNDKECEPLRNQYVIWERDDFFSSIVAVAIPKSLTDHQSVGVLNLNFAAQYPFGKQNVLPPETRKRIEDVLSPHLLTLSHVIQCREPGR